MKRAQDASFTAAEREILEFLHSEQDSYYRGDFDAFIKHWHHGPEVRRVLSGPHVGTRVHVGWDALLPRFKEGMRQFLQNYDAQNLLRWDNIQIQVSGDLAWIYYDLVTLSHEPGMHVAPFSHETKIVQRFDGAWKIVGLFVAAPGIGREDAPRIELDAQGHLVGLNNLASERLPGHPGLTISGRRPRCKNRAFDAGLQAAIKHCRQRLATNLPRGFLNEQAQVVPLGEDEAGQPIFCWVVSEQERVLISFDDKALLRTRMEKAGDSFGLSPAQQNLAVLFAAGKDLANAAATLGVSINTVRTQVRRMFEKTQTHNQAALVSRLLNVMGPE